MHKTKTKKSNNELQKRYRLAAYEDECKTGSAYSCVDDPKSTAEAIQRLADIHGDESLFAAREIENSDDPIAAYQEVLKDTDPAVLKYLLAECSYKFFSKTYLPHHVERPFAPLYHDPFFAALRKVETHTTRTPLVVAGPRDWGKSTLGAVMLPIHCIVFPVFRYFPNGKVVDISKRYISLISLEQKSSKRHLSSICYEFENNEFLQEDFGDFYRDSEKVTGRRDNEWTKVAVTTLNHKRIETHSRKSKLRGMLWHGRRPDLPICDDVDDDEQAHSRTRREADVRWMRNIVMNCVRKENGNILIMGNYVVENGVFAQMLQDGEEKGWERLLFRTYDVDPETQKKSYIWPEAFGPDFESDKRDDIGDEAYEEEYQQDPTSRNRELNKNSFLHYRYEEIVGRLNDFPIFAAIDQAGTVTRRSDFTAITAVAYDADARRAFVLPSFHGKIGTLAQRDQIFAMQQRFRPFWFGIEAGASQGSLIEIVEHKAREERILIAVEKITQPGGELHKKPRIAMRLFPRILQGEILFLDNDPVHQAMEHELIYLQTTDHDDLADALEMAVRLLDKWLDEIQRQNRGVKVSVVNIDLISTSDNESAPRGGRRRGA